MSYLLDALRKAERERNLGRVPDLAHADQNSDSTAGRRIPAWVLPVVLGLALLNLVLLGAFWWMGQGNDAVPAAPAPSQATVTAAAPAAAPAPPARPVYEPASPDVAPTPATPAAEPEFDPEPEPEPEPIAEAPQYNALEPGQRSQIPSLSINGHLYSSIPGRSFVLVNGRRYHEGQRLPEGPAIVLIDEQGAVFKYRDISYRLDAPG